ncbi:GGDEF domain-containing protein [Rhodoferax aquaticus]|uniref:diguanylate cyclase n=1 Tax=Rhodoferax aquaticus TaxID=2527691 RepID=A0A515EUR9_9BURK|nr:diguanylate cyclase [Rhodoferax aquaticus]QDL56424.1 sensor domain-containing diguanylate cyclase [Rhodoferax aquaticus]
MIRTTLTLQALRDRLRSTLQQYQAIQPEATLESLRRFRVFAMVTLVINVLYAVQFLTHADVALGPAPYAWTMGIGLLHAAMACLMALLGFFSHRAVRHPRASARWGFALQMLVCATALAFACGLMVLDQWVLKNSTPFVLICLVVGMMSLMRPRFAVLLFGGAYIGLYFALAHTQPNAEMLAQTRGDARLVFIISAVVSYVVWRQYVVATLLRQEVATAQKALADKQTALEYLATHDPLTGLFNRREFSRLAEQELARAARYPCPTSVVMVDLDFFKRINDQYGHPVGDHVLVHVAAIVQKMGRSVDVAARFGGEEFIALLPNTTVEGAMTFAENLRQAIEASALQAGEFTVRATASMGVTCLPLGATASLDTLYAAADRGLYAAKQAGRNRVEFCALARLA